MKKTKTIFIFSILFCLIFPLLTFAQIIKIENPLEYDTFKKLVEAVVTFIAQIAIVLAPLMIVIGAFYFMTSGGDPAKIETGKKIITYTCIGLIVVLSAWALVAIIQNVLGVK